MEPYYQELRNNPKNSMTNQQFEEWVKEKLRPEIGTNKETKITFEHSSFESWCVELANAIRNKVKQEMWNAIDKVDGECIKDIEIIDEEITNDVPWKPKLTKRLVTLKISLKDVQNDDVFICFSRKSLLNLLTKE